MDSKAEEWSCSAAERAERTSESPLVRSEDMFFAAGVSPTLKSHKCVFRREAGRRAQHGC